jgi:predicted phage tail protein
VAAGTYYVRVRGANAAGVGAASDDVIVIVGPGGGTRSPAGAPVNVTATAVGGDVTLRWTATGSASAYIIEAGSVPGARDLANFSTGSSATEFHASGIGAGVYYVRVRAVSSAGVSGASNEATLVVGNAPSPSACGALSAPGQLAASVSGSVVTLNWGAAAGQPSSYVIEAGSRSGAADLVVTDVGSATSLTATNVGAGTYFVRVRAKNRCATGAPSNEIAVTVR